MKFDVVFRFDAGEPIGLGHLRRCEALMEGFETHGLKRFAILTRTPAHVHEWLGERALIVPLQAKHFAAELAEWARFLETAIVRYAVVDRYGISDRYLKKLRGQVPVLVAISDEVLLGDYPVQAVLNPNVYGEKLSYPSSTGARCFLGPRYALIRQEFFRYRSRGENLKINTLFAALGGYAEEGLFDRIEKAAALLSPVPKLLKAGGRVKKMGQLVSQARMAVSAAGVTTSELCYLGVPMLLVVLAQNQLPIARTLERVGAAINLGWYKRLSAAGIFRKLRLLWQNPEKRAQMSKAGRALIDGQGAHRFAGELINYFGRLDHENCSND